MTRTRQDVEVYLAREGLRARVLRMPANTHTAADAARALGTDLAHIAKSLLAHLADGPKSGPAAGRFVLCILRGDTRLDRRKLCRAAGAKRMTLATADEVLAVTGYPVGAVPPFPLATEVPVYIDRNVPAIDVVYCGGGEVDALVEVSTAELVRASRGRIVDLEMEPESLERY